MTTILPPERSPLDVIMGQIGGSLSQNLPQIINRLNLKENLGNLKKLASQPGIKPIDLITSAIESGAGIPGSERYMSTLLPMLGQIASANASQNAPVAGEQRNREPLQPPPQRPEAPNFLNQQQQQGGQFFPSNAGPQGGPGQVPQAATTGVKQPLRTRAEKVPDARKLSKLSTEAGIPMTVPQAMEQINMEEEEKKEHNRLVDEELKQRIQGQKTYGERAVDELKKVYPEADPETQAIFQKIGEEESKKGESEADINRFLAKKANQFKSAITNVQKDTSAPRLHNSILRAMEGTYKNFEQSGADARKHLQPMLDLGLYDKARNLLAEQGYGPEEREIIINPLSERSKSIINQVPNYKRIETGKGRFGVKANEKPPSKEPIKSALIDMKKNDPNFSLVLARKAFEDKGYDWRVFKDTLNELENEGFKLEDDQEKQRGILDKPPVNILYKMLEGINIIGR